MPTWIVDTFSVKPTGIFASVRWLSVLTDDNGNISTQDVPGKPSINQPCISDYKHNFRAYADGQLITEFCNLDTFTNYRIYAQNCFPFAYTQTDINAPKCGYLTPLPTPAVPPNPFGNATYGLYKSYSFCDKLGETILVNISKKAYVGIPSVIENGALSPVILSYKNQDDNKFFPFKPCELTLILVAQTDFQLADLFTEDEREFKIEVYRSARLKFAGFIVPDNSQEPFRDPPYEVTIRATDGLGGLQKVSYPLPIGSSIELRQTFKDILCYALSQTNLGLELHTICNVYEKKMPSTLNDDPLAMASVNPLRMVNGTTIYTCYDAIKEVCKVFGAFLVQENGAWIFARTNELSDTIIRKRVYNSTGFFLRGENVSNGRFAGSEQAVLMTNRSTILRKENAYKRVVVDLQFGDSPALVYNGDFETYDGQNFPFWTKYGNVDVSQVQKTITGTGGAQLLLDDHALQFNHRDNNGKWLESNPIQVYAGDKLSFSFDWYTNLNIAFPLFKIRFKLGQYYYYVPFGPGPSSWVQQLATASLYPLPQSGLFPTTFSFLPFRLDMEPVPEDGKMVIQIFGAENARAQLGNVDFPVQFDNVAINKSADDKNEPVGSFYISQQLRFFTNAPDTIETIFGDYKESLLQFRPGRDQSFQVAQNNLYSIYTVDGSYSTAWKPYSQLGNEAPLNQILAREILKAYQSPFWFMEGTFKGANLSILDVFQVVTPNNANFAAKTWAISSADFDISRQEMQATWYEIFNKYIQTTDINLTHNSGVTPPPFTQNPNNPTLPKGARIFTDQFTDQFI